MLRLINFNLVRMFYVLKMVVNVSVYTVKTTYVQSTPAADYINKAVYHTIRQNHLDRDKKIKRKEGRLLGQSNLPCPTCESCIWTSTTHTATSEPPSNLGSRLNDTDAMKSLPGSIVNGFPVSAL